MDVLKDRAAVQRGPAGWSYRPTGLVDLSTDKCKACTSARTSLCTSAG